MLVDIDIMISLDFKRVDIQCNENTILPAGCSDLFSNQSVYLQYINDSWKFHFLDVEPCATNATDDGITGLSRL